MAQPVDDQFNAVGGAIVDVMNKLVGEAVGIDHLDEPPVRIVIIPGHRYTKAILDAGDVMRELRPKLVKVFVRGVTPCVAVIELEDLYEIAGVLVVNVLDDGQSIASANRVVNPSDAVLGVPVKPNGVGVRAVGVLM